MGASQGDRPKCCCSSQGDLGGVDAWKTIGSPLCILGDESKEEPFPRILSRDLRPGIGPHCSLGNQHRAEPGSLCILRGDLGVGIGSDRSLGNRPVCDWGEGVLSPCSLSSAHGVGIPSLQPGH